MTLGQLTPYLCSYLFGWGLSAMLTGSWKPGVIVGLISCSAMFTIINGDLWMPIIEQIISYKIW